MHTYMTLNTLFNFSMSQIFYRITMTPQAIQPHWVAFLTLLILLDSRHPILTTGCPWVSCLCRNKKHEHITHFFLQLLGSNILCTQLPFHPSLQADRNKCFPPSLNITPLFHSSISFLNFCRASLGLFFKTFFFDPESKTHIMIFPFIAFEKLQYCIIVVDGSENLKIKNKNNRKKNVIIHFY